MRAETMILFNALMVVPVGNVDSRAPTCFHEKRLIAKTGSGQHHADENWMKTRGFAGD